MSSEFEITILASGSKGNAAVIRAGEQAFLVDVGISCRQLTERLHQAGMKPEDLTGVLLTHEHNDHVKGLPVFCRKYRLPVFANERTWQYGTQLLPLTAQKTEQRQFGNNPFCRPA